MIKNFKCWLYLLILLYIKIIRKHKVRSNNLIIWGKFLRYALCVYIRIKKIINKPFKILLIAKKNTKVVGLKLIDT